jgi:hypothetical protein
MCVPLQEGVLSVSCTGGAVRVGTKGYELRAETTRFSFAALEVFILCVCVCVCVNIPVRVL